MKDTTDWFKTRDPVAQAISRTQLEEHIATFTAQGGVIEVLGHAACSTPPILSTRVRGVAARRKKIKEP